MLRFFRKYQKYILAVGGTILLIIFLVPQAIQGIGNYSARRGRTVATFVGYDGTKHKVSAAEYDLAQRELAVLVQGGRALAHLGGDQFLSLPLLQLLGIGEIEQPEHWLLLVHEADSHGLISAGAEDAQAAAARIAEQVNQMLIQSGRTDGLLEHPEEVIARIVDGSDMPIGFVTQTLNKAMGVQRLMSLYSGGITKISTARLIEKADQLLQGIDARTVVILAQVSQGDSQGRAEPPAGEEPAGENGAQPADDEPVFTDEELQAQLEQYADVKEGEGDRGFGYRLPDRVQLEWLEVEPARVRDALEKTDRLSRLEVRKYWLRNKDKFPVPGAEEPTFEQVEDRVKRQLLNELTQETLDNISRFIEGEITRTTRELAREGTYYALPENWSERRLSFFDLANAVQERFGVLPGYHSRGDQWYSAQEVRNLEGVGRAFTMEFGRRLTLTELIPLLREFGGSNTIFVQEGIAIGPLALSDGALYFVRLLDTQASHAPASIDEVRDQLVRDLKKLRAYSELVENGEELRRIAYTQGMEALAAEHSSVVSPQRNIGYAPPDSQLARFFTTRLMPPVGNDEKAITGIVDRGREVLVNIMREGRRFEDLTLEERTFVVEVPHKLAVIVVQLTDARPLTREQLADYTTLLRNVLFVEEIGSPDRIAPTLEQLQERHAYTSTTPAREEDEDADAETDAAAETASTDA